MHPLAHPEAHRLGRGGDHESLEPQLRGHLDEQRHQQRAVPLLPLRLRRGQDGHLQRGVVRVRLRHRGGDRHPFTAEHEATRLRVLSAQVDQVVVEHGEGGAHHLLRRRAAHLGATHQPRHPGHVSHGLLAALGERVEQRLLHRGAAGAPHVRLLSVWLPRLSQHVRRARLGDDIGRVPLRRIDGARGDRLAVAEAGLAVHAARESAVGIPLEAADDRRVVCQQRKLPPCRSWRRRLLVLRLQLS